MSQFHTGWFLVGFLVWAVATVALWFIGPFVFERGLLIWVSFSVVVVAGFIVLFVLIERLVLKTSTRQRPSSALSFAVGGMIGEVPVLLLFDRVMTPMDPAAAGAFGAFLFAGYAALLAYAIRTPAKR